MFYLFFPPACRVLSRGKWLIALLMGLVWIGQGLHVGPAPIMRGFMVSDWRWALYGAILAALGVGQVVWTNPRKA